MHIVKKIQHVTNVIKKVKVILIQPVLMTIVTHSSRPSLKIGTHKDLYNHISYIIWCTFF